jgi:hypothetical protein
MRSLIAVLLLIACIGRVLAQAPPSSLEDLRKLYEQKQYSDVVKEATRMLRLKGDAARTFDRYGVLMLKGDAQIQLKQGAQATEAFAQAQKETTDPKKLADAKACELLVKKSRGMMYTPKTSPPPSTRPSTNPSAAARKGAINIGDESARSDALNALFNDEWTLAKPKVESLKKRGGLAPLMDAVKLIDEVRPLELAATGNDTQTKQQLTTLSETAKRLMDDYLRKTGARVDEISRSANTRTQVQNGFRKRGLTGQEMQELKDASETAARIEPAAAEMGKAMGVGADPFAETVKAAEQLKIHAKEVLEADYTSIDRF